MSNWRGIVLGLLGACCIGAVESLGAGETLAWEVAGVKEVWVHPQGARLELTGWGGVKLALTEGNVRPVRVCGAGDDTLRVRSLERVQRRSFVLERRAETRGGDGCALQMQARATSDLAARAELLRKAGEAYEATSDWYGLAETLTPLGEALWELGKTEEALRIHEKAIETWTKVIGGDGRRAEAMVTLAVGYSLLPQTRAKYAATIQQALRLARVGKDAVAEGLALCNVVTDLSFGGAGVAGEGDGRTMGLKAVEMFRKADYRAGEAVAWNALGQWLQNRSLEESAGAFRESLRLRRELDDEAGVAQSLNNLAGVLNRQGEPQEAVAMLEEALAIRKRVAAPRAVANTQHNLGVQYVEAGNLDKALELYEAAMLAWVKTGDKFGEAATLTEMATAYSRRGALDRAERAFERALALQRSLGRKRVESNVLRGWAGVLREKGQDRVAMEKAREAERIAREGKFPMELARALQEQAMLESRVQNFDAALRLLKEAREIARGASRPDYGHVLAAMGHALREAGKTEDALAVYEEAEKVAVALESVGDRQSVHAGRSMALLAKGDVAGAKEQALLGMALLEDWRANLASPSSRAELLDRRHLVYEAAVAAFMRSGETAAAFEASEKGRARGLAEEVESGMGTAPIREEARALRARVAAKSATLLRLRTQGAGEAELRKARAGLAVLEDRYAAMRERWAREYPELEKASAPASLAEVRGALRPGEALLEYSVGARESFAWVVTREGITGTRITGRAADWQPTGLSKYKKIYVAPDGELYGVGFAGKMPAEWPGALAIVPSGKALTLLKAPAKLAGRRVVVFADPLYEAGATAGSGLRFPRLRFSAMEAAAISRIWGRQVAQRLGAEASREALLRTKWEGVGLAHIAAHADFDSLVLSLYDGTGRALDGQLRMEDVAAMRLDKALVVLSACGTAAGKSLRGEGPMSLARAFLGAGAAGVVATLWPVDDAASARLMEAFHEGLKLKGLGPAEALRQAQMAVRREARWESPHYWAGWVYVGR